ncbi:unnamed protein product [Clavelina lepadiformis]|uniref:Uncharacterized protein n=1 Tax=Clavelina lepadiformis TaxID=159417 RepID=A0ABP0GJZ7_CLALP
MASNRICFTICFFLVYLALPSAELLICQECENVRTNEECLDQKKPTVCSEDQTACATEVRCGGWGKKKMIKKMCQQKEACQTDYIQDSGEGWVFKPKPGIQCSGKPPSSFCRCCCTKNLCNQDAEDCGGKPKGGKPCDSL